MYWQLKQNMATLANTKIFLGCVCVGGLSFSQTGWFPLELLSTTMNIHSDKGAAAAAALKRLRHATKLINKNTARRGPTDRGTLECRGWRRWGGPGTHYSPGEGGRGLGGVRWGGGSGVGCWGIGKSAFQLHESNCFLSWVRVNETN